MAQGNEPLPPPPTGPLLAWLANNPEQARAYMQRVYAMDNVLAVVTFNGKTKSYPVKWSASNGVIEIKLS